ncbi:MAG: 4-hydroxythreonine-4-phosphate dehydrogenase PdxA [Candidatus Puniceispirillaceae bacterium]
MSHHLTITPLLITPGDPAGIGPEIALKALTSDPVLRKSCVLIGDKRHLSQLGQTLGLNCEFAKWTPGDPLQDDKINLAEIFWPCEVISGQPDNRHADLIIESITTAVQLARQGDVRGLITCPIAKSNLYEAGFTYPGHTEYLGALSSTGPAVMMLANQSLRVVPATIHIPLAKVADTLTQQDLSDLICHVAGALRSDFNITLPHIGLCGLNPHAGENGAMGQEEKEIITPAIAKAKSQLGTQAKISGPYAADSLFHHDKRQQFDCIIGMYHDQVLIPVKTIDFHGTVNITTGLDFIRTSPDHGTAFDIAGKGLASPDSLINAIYQAQSMANNRYGPVNDK